LKQTIFFLLVLAFPISGPALTMSRSLSTSEHHEVPPDRFGLPLSAPDAANVNPNRDTEIRLPPVYRTEATGRGGFPGDSITPKRFSLYRSETSGIKPSPPKATARLIGNMQKRYHGIVEAAVSSLHAISASTVYAVMWVECKGQVRCTSDRGAEGPMQLTAITQEELGIEPGDAFKPKIAIPKAAEYLETNYKTFGTLPAAILAYGIGPNKARSYLRKRHDPMEHPYVKQVLQARMLM